MEPQAAENTPNLNPPASEPVPASVVVLKLQDYGRRPVTEQARLKGDLEALASKALQPLGAAERIVLDAPDALAVVVLDRPQAALELAERCEAAAGELPLCVGVNHGPVRAANDPLRGPGIVGDGIATGMVLAHAATPGRLLASRPFHEALEASKSRRAADLAAAGELTDANVRRHQIYTLNPRPARPGAGRALLIVGAVAVVIVAIPFVLHRFPAELKVDEAPAPNQVVRVAPTTNQAEPAAPARTLEPPKPPAFKPKPAPPKPASILFQVKPHGYVYIDGVAKGRTPPLSRLEISPGRHAVEVRNGRYPPLKLQVNLSRAEEMTVTHTFVTPPPRKEGLIPRWRRKLGI
jgi:hypothetical protein